MDELSKLKIRAAELETALAAAQHQAQHWRDELSSRERELELLHQFERELTRSEDSDFVLDHVLNWTKLRTQSDYGLIARWDNRQQALEVLQSAGFALAKDYQKGDLLALPPDLTPQAVTDQREISLRFDDSQTTMLAELRHADGKLIGVLMMQRHSGIKYSPTDRIFMRLVADRLAIAMHHSLLLKQVAESGEHRQQLFRLLSHNLRQPLTVLAGYIQLMEYNLKRGNTTGIELYIQNISKGASDLNELLEEVLLVERVASLTPDSWETISLLKVCQAAVEKHRPQAELAEHTLVILLPEAEAACKGIEAELKAAAGNLISNAIKYTPKGGRIEVSLQADGARWRFEVKDNGYGIDPQRQAKLFESFYRAQQPGTENIKGTGLGLNLVKRIVEKHDGDIFFSSTAGNGSTFGFWLPQA
jgi:signal transduction histidine kinase